ncbi:MAG: hypothetical protein LC750_11325 [Actinobacteria bacterium]|nr:hypothetical protein [Actinomycetota bacterium]
MDASTNSRATRNPTWTQAHNLSGYQVHAATYSNNTLLLAGERTGSTGVLLEYKNNTLTELNEFSDARQIRAIEMGNVTTFLGGEDTSGHGYLIAGPPYLRIPLPHDFTEIDALLTSDRAIVAAGSTGRSAAVIESRDAGRHWRIVARVVPVGEFARLTTLARVGSQIVSGGTDGRNGVLTVGKLMRPMTSLASVASVVSAGRKEFISGYAGLDESVRRGVLLVGDARLQHWKPVRLPPGVGFGGAAFWSRDSGAVLSATGVADEIAETSDGGATWTRIALGETIEGIVAQPGRAAAFGLSGLFLRDAF